MTATDPTTTARPTRLAVDLALLLLLATLWGASYTFIKVGVATIPPITFIAARTAIAGVVLLAILRGRGLAMPRDPALWGRFAVQAGLNSVVPFTLIAWAERTVDSGLAVILNSTTPIFAFLMTALITRHEAVGVRKAFGVAAGLAGITLIIGLDAFAGVGVPGTVAAEIAIVVASICYAVASIYGKGFQGLDPMMPAAGSLVAGALMLTPVAMIVDRPWTVTPSTASAAALLALSLLSTALAFVLYFRLIHTLGSVGTTAQAYLRVPIGVAIGVVFLGESLGPTAWIGCAAVVAGVAAMTLPGRR